MEPITIEQQHTKIKQNKHDQAENEAKHGPTNRRMKIRSFIHRSPAAENAENGTKDERKMGQQTNV